MLAYNIRKLNLEKSDPVREILAKLEAKQSKTGLSLYNQKHSDQASIKQGDYSHPEEKPFFPDVKVARTKAHNRITSETNRYESSQQQIQTKQVTHRLPSNKADVATNQNFVPVSFSHGMQKWDERIQQSYNIPDQQFDKDKIDININPFGYNRKTLAYQSRNINYVIEWPETWPFKITSFQRKRKQPLKSIKRPNQGKSFNKTQNFPDEYQQLPEISKEYPFDARAKVLAPIDHPSKKQTLLTKPYVESSAIKRGARKYISKEEGKQIISGSYENEVDLISPHKENDVFLRTGEPRKGENDSVGSETESFIAQSPTSSPNTKLIKPEISKERVDSVPPSTPVPNEENPRNDAEISLRDIHRDINKDDPNSLLTDIVNQIVEESTPMTI